MKNSFFVGFWSRVLMTIIDLQYYLMLIIYAEIFDRFILKFPKFSDEYYFYRFSTLVIIPVIILFLLWKYYGASLAKIMFNVRIIDIRTGNHPKDKQLLCRLLGNLLSCISFFFSYIHVGLDSRKQSWHDKIARTAVVRISPSLESKTVNNISTRKQDKRLLTVEIGVSSFLFIILLIFVFFKLYDEPLLPEAKEWLNTEHSIDENPEENGFYYLIGLNCSEESNPFDVGYKWFKNQERIVNEKHSKTTNSRKPQENQINNNFNKINTKIIAENFFLPNRSDDLDYYFQKKDFIDSLMISFDFLLERLDTLYSYPYFTTPTLPHNQSLSSISISSGVINNLRLAWIAKEYKIGNRQKAIEELYNQTNKLKNLKHNSLLLTSSSTKSYANGLKLYSVFIDDSSLEQLELIKQYLPNPCHSEEKNWDQIAIAFFHQMNKPLYKSYDFILSESGTNSKIFKIYNKFERRIHIKLNKSINNHFVYCKNLKILSEFNAKDFIEEKDKFLQFRNNRWDSMFNPISSLNLFSCYPDIGSEIAIYHDIEGYINMLKLKIIIKEQNIPSDKISEFLENQSDSLNNPYTEKPFDWDQVNSALHFKGPYKDIFKLRELKVKF